MIKSVIIPAVLIGCFGLTAYLISQNTKEAPKRPKTRHILNVEVNALKPQPYTITIESHGDVQAYQSSDVATLVSAQVLAVSKTLHIGAHIKKGDTLLTLDRTDYLAAVAMAEATLKQAEQQLLEQQALADSAKVNWQREGFQDEPSPLTLREPHVTVAKANVAAARAQLNQARIQLQRTIVRAPFDGIVTHRLIDVAEHAKAGQVVATLLATERAKVRVPLTLSQLNILTGGTLTLGEKTPTVKVSHDNHHWQGTLVRLDGNVDTQTRQLYGTVYIENPYRSNARPLRVGSFVSVAIIARTLNNVIAIDRQAVQEGNQVIVVDAHKTLQKKTIKPLWSDNQSVVIAADTWDPSLRLVTTPLGIVIPGTPVTIKGEGQSKKNSLKRKTTHKGQIPNTNMDNVPQS